MRKLNLTICNEDLKCRIPGLFACISKDENDIWHLVKANEFEHGSYGQFVENIQLPPNTSLYIYELNDSPLDESIYIDTKNIPDIINYNSDDYIKVDGKFYDKKLILENGTVYSFKTLLNEYNKYKNLISNKNGFIKFFERAIGLINIDRDVIDDYVQYLNLPSNEINDIITALHDETVTNLIPDKIYLAESRFKYNEMVKLGKVSLYYNNISDLYNEYKLLMNLCKYQNEGNISTNFIVGKYKSKFKYVDLTIDYFDDFCKNGGNILKNQLDDIKEQSDLYFRMGGKCMELYLADLVAELDTISTEMYNLSQVNDKASVTSNIQLYSTIDNIGIYETVLNEWIGGKEYIKGEIVTYDFKSWICIYDNNGIYDPESESFIFDETKFKLLGDDINEKYSDTNTNGGYYDIKNGEEIINGVGNSKLKEVRSYKDYVNHNGITEYPLNGEDWLFYYRIGNVSGIEIINDDNGNIMIEDNAPALIPNQYCEHLYAYGNIINDITYDDSKKTFTIIYTIGAHLKAKYKGSVSHDGNDILYFDKFEYHDDNIHGVKYIETYKYEIGSEIDQIIQNGDFNVFFKGNSKIIIKYNSEYLIPNVNLMRSLTNPEHLHTNTDDYLVYSTKNSDGEIIDKYYKGNGNRYILIDVDIKDYSYNKFKFNLNSNINIITININNRQHTRSNVLSNYEAYQTKKTDFLYSPTTKIDYLNGIVENPSINKDVLIDRGNNSAWERHIKLGEIKTMQDLENYGNNYFSIYNN